MSRKKWIALSVLILILSMMACGTAAFFTADARAHNVITTGLVSVEVREWTDGDKTVRAKGTGLTGVMPGTRITRITEVVNTGNADVYLRLRIDKTVRQASGEDADASVVALTVGEQWERYWEYRDGYYYYKEALAPGAATAIPVFEGVSFEAGMDNRYQGCTAEIRVSAFAVQSANNGADVWSASGWPDAA